MLGSGQKGSDRHSEATAPRSCTKGERAMLARAARRRDRRGCGAGGGGRTSRISV